MQRQVSTVEVPQTQRVDKAVDVPVAMPRQTPVIQRVQKTEIPQIQFIVRVVDVPVMAQEQVLSVQRFQAVFRGKNRLMTPWLPSTLEST